MRKALHTRHERGDVLSSTHRPGLTSFVTGLLRGLSALYETPVSIRLSQSRAEGAEHDIFDIRWDAPLT